MSKLSLHSIEDKPPEELPVLSQEELEALKDPNVITNQIALLKAQCNEMKPNLGAIAEYKRKVRLITAMQSWDSSFQYCIACLCSWYTPH